MNTRIAKNIERSTKSNVTGSNANDFVKSIFAVGGKIRQPQAAGEAWRVEMVQPGGSAEVPSIALAFWFTIEGSGVEATVRDIYGADVNIYDEFIHVEVHQPYAEGADKVRSVELPQAGPEPRLVLPGQEGQTAYDKTMPRRLTASAGRNETWMPAEAKAVSLPEDRGSAVGKVGPQALHTKLAIAEMANAQAAAGAEAEADKLIDKFLGTVEDKRAELLEMYALAFVQHTSLKPEQASLVQWTDDSGAVHLKFVRTDEDEFYKWCQHNIGCTSGTWGTSWTKIIPELVGRLRTSMKTAIEQMRERKALLGQIHRDWIDGLADVLELALEGTGPTGTLNVSEIDLSGHPADVLDRLAKSSGRMLAPDWDEQIEALRTACNATVKPDGTETLMLWMSGSSTHELAPWAIFFPGTTLEEAENYVASQDDSDKYESEILEVKTLRIKPSTEGK